VQTVETEPERGRAGSEALDADARERGPEARLESVRGQCNGRPPAGLLCYAFSASPTS
jgi:hypothetical protein